MQLVQYIMNAIHPNDIKEKLLKLVQYVIKIKKERALKYDWNKNARANQLPCANWSVWLILAGRGFGKTRTGAETIRQCVKDGYKRIGIIGHTIQDIEQVMLYGESGLMNITPEEEKPRYYKAKNLLKWKNGAIGVCISACASEQLRGHQFDCVWIDELAKFADPDEVFNQVNLALRLNNEHGESPKMLITTTPRSISLLQELRDNPKVHKTYGSTFDNAQNLSEQFLENVNARYGDSKFGKQELYGELLDQNEGLCNREYVQYRAYGMNDCASIIVAIDPSVGGGDETGIIVAGVLKNDCLNANDAGKYIVLEDASGQYKASLWPEIAINLYKKYHAKCIVAEVNQGGDMIESLLRQVDASIVYNKVYANKNKITRAQPVIALYEKAQVYHASQFSVLEKQLCENTKGKIGGVRSPDRLDALVWALTFLAENYRRSKMDLLFFAV